MGLEMGFHMESGKKRLLIVNNNLVAGGVQRSLINLINEIKYDYDITLFLFFNGGEYKEEIPNEVNVMEASLFLKLLGASQAQTRRLGILEYCFRGILALHTKHFSNHIPIHLLTLAHKKLFGFEVAISFLHCAEEKTFYGGCNEFVLHRINAKQKIAFLHCDFYNYGGNTIKNKLNYRSFDKIAVVSEGCKQSFIRAIPELASKTFCVYNCHNYSDILRQGNDNPVVYKNNYTNIVTVARLSKEKGILRGIEAVKELLLSGYKFKWHIVGGGSQKIEIEATIDKNGMAEYIHLYGNQRNPFRYIKNADLLLIPSYHEAAPMVIGEAKCLGVPVLTTDTISAKEMIAEGKEGFICENSEYGISEMLKNILDNPGVLHECRKHLAKQQYTNKKALLQFHNLIDERA